MAFSAFFRPTQKMGPDGPKWGQEDFFPTNPDLADILGRTDLDFENFYFFDLLGPKILAWAQLGPTHLGPSTWAPRGPTHLGPAWAHPRGPTHLGPAWAHPLGAFLAANLLTYLQSTVARGYP